MLTSHGLFTGGEISRGTMLIMMTGTETHAIGWPIEAALPIVNERLTYREQGIEFFFPPDIRAGLRPCSHILPISHHSRTCAHFRLSLYRCQPPLTPSPIPCTHRALKMRALQFSIWSPWRTNRHTNKPTDEQSLLLSCVSATKSNIAPELSKTFHAIKRMLIT